MSIKIVDPAEFKERVQPVPLLDETVIAAENDKKGRNETILEITEIDIHGDSSPGD